MKKLFLYLLLMTVLVVVLLYAQTREDPGKLSPIPTFYKGRWIKTGEIVRSRLCPWVDITLGFPSLVQIAVRFAFDTYIYEECSNVMGIDCRIGAKQEIVVYGSCD